MRQYEVFTKVVDIKLVYFFVFKRKTESHSLLGFIFTKIVTKPIARKEEIFLQGKIRARFRFLIELMEKKDEAPLYKEGQLEEERQECPR